MSAVTLHPNLANDKQLVTRVKDELIVTLKRMRDERRSLDQSFLRYYRIWSAERDQQSYAGRSKTYMTIGRRIIENWVQKVKRDLLTTDDWFDVIALRESFEQRVPAVKALFNYYIKKQMRLRRKLTPFLRQMVTLGTSPVSIVWRLDERVLPVLKDVLDADNNPTNKQIRSLEKVLQYIGPTFRICDLFAWRISPVTVSEVGEATHVSEDMLIDRARLKQLAKTPLDPREPKLGMILENLDDAFEKFGSSSSLGADTFQKERERLQAKGFSGRMDPKNPARPLDVTTAYWRVNLEDEGTDWYRVTIIGDETVCLIQRNPFWHGMPPWLVGKFTEVENEFYGRSVCEAFDRLQYFLNDVADQSNDALVWCMNPIAVVDGYRVQDPTSLRMRPGAKWLAEPGAVQFMEPPKDTPAIGFNAVQQIVGFMNDVSNVAPFVGGGGGGPRNRGRALNTATGAQIVASENLVQVRDVIENVEDQVMIPMLKMMHILTMQCLDRDITLRITGAQGLTMIEHKISAPDVVGDFDFEWLGSTGAMNQTVKSQQMINYLQIAAQVPPELYKANNIQLDIGYLMKAIWSDGFGLRNADRVIRDLSPMKSVDPRLENDLFLAERGEEVKVSPADNDVGHIKQHQPLVGNHDTPDSQIPLVIAHIQEHHAAQLTKQIMQQMQAQAQAQQQLGGGGGQPPPAGPGGGPGMPLNPGRPQQTSSADDVFRSIARTPGGTQGEMQ